MIKIEHPEIIKIANIHYNACKSYIEPRLNFLIDLFNALGYDNYKSVPNLFSLKINSLAAILDPVLKESKKRKKNAINVKMTEIESAIKNCANNIIDSNIKKDQFKLFYTFFENVKNNLKNIIEGSPEELSKIIKDKKYKTQSDNIVKLLIESIFNYEQLTKDGFELGKGKNWDSYELTRELDLSVCPYCNRNWIVTITGGSTKKKVVNPQLDHFFSKSKYPILRLSFFNLIPSCETCNARLKRKTEFKIDQNLHPHMEGYGNSSKFKVIANNYDAQMGIGNDYRVELEHFKTKSELKSKIDKNHKLFEINKIYEKHGDIIAELFRKKQIFSEKYIEILQHTFPKMGLSKEEMYRIAFGNYFNQSDFKKRPFAKLTKDIAEDLGMI